MTPKLFYRGQSVTKTDTSGWKNDTDNWNGDESDPKFGKVYTICDHEFHGVWYISLIEFPQDQFYLESNFAPVIESSVLEKELSKIPEPVEL